MLPHLQPSRLRLPHTQLPGEPGLRQVVLHAVGDGRKRNRPDERRSLPVGTKGGALPELGGSLATVALASRICHRILNRKTGHYLKEGFGVIVPVVLTTVVCSRTLYGCKSQLREVGANREQRDAHP